MDSWYNKPSQSDLTPYQWKTVEYYEVKSEMQKKAQLLLQSDSIVSISQQQASDFVEGNSSNQKGIELYLVRGLVLNEGTGSFTVYCDEDRLWVKHGCLGKHPVPMKRKALVISLPKKPSEIFVTCSMVE